MNQDKLKHSLAVANKMVEIGKKYSMSSEELEDLFVLGFNHDVAYGISDDVLNHGIIGGDVLKRNGYKYWKEVYYHGKPDCEYNSKYLTILNMADMMIDKFGNDVGYDNRLEDILKRRGKNSIQYTNCVKLVASLKEIEKTGKLD